MEGNKLDCCVVRDLLPAYVEELTEPETAEQVRSHLAECAACREMEAHMRQAVPLRQAPRRALRFLRRVRRTRLIAALLSALVALWCMWWLYDREYHYPDTEAGWLAAVEDYIPSPADSTSSHRIEPDTPLRVLAARTRGNELYVAYAADNADRVHGVVRLERGWNGKYRTLSASMAPFPYTAGVLETELTAGDGTALYLLAGDTCREIYGIRVTWYMALNGAKTLSPYEKTYPVTEPDFLWLLGEAELKKDLGIPEETEARAAYTQIALLDREGRDVTEEYRDDSVQDNWGGGKGTAELFLLNAYMGIAALLGVVFVRYFLRRD